MNPSGEVRWEEMGMGETMKDVVTMVDAMTSAVETVEAMVMAVEMREWLEVGRPETERTTAVHFFSRALAVQKRKDGDGYFLGFDFPLYWPGHLPGLIQLFADCLLPHNSKAIQSGAMLSIKYLPTCLRADYEQLDYESLFSQFGQEVNDHAFGPLRRLVRETDCTKIRDQAVQLLGHLVRYWCTKPTIDAKWKKGLSQLMADLIHKYAAISEPTETEISSLNTAIKALNQVYVRLAYPIPHNNPPPPFPPFSWQPDILDILPVLIGIFKEPGNHKNAQTRAGQFLHSVAWTMDGNFLLENGMMDMLLDILRVGKEPTAVLAKALDVLRAFICHNNFMDVVNNGTVYVKKVVDMGALDVFHLVLKRPNDSFKESSMKGETLWTCAIHALGQTIVRSTGENMEAVLSQKGLVELVLDLALGAELSEETQWFLPTMTLLWMLAKYCSESQMRGLILKGPFFRLLHRYFNYEGYGFSCAHWTFPRIVQECLARSSAENQRTIRLLLDDTGITDDIRRISLDVPMEGRLSVKERACHILDTYLNHPLPPLPTHNLPSIIYTRNAPS